MDEADEEEPGENGETNALRAQVFVDSADAGPIGLAAAVVAIGAIAVWAKVRRKKA